MKVAISKFINGRGDARIMSIGAIQHIPHRRVAKPYPLIGGACFIQGWITPGYAHRASAIRSLAKLDSSFLRSRNIVCSSMCPDHRGKPQAPDIRSEERRV